MTISSWIVVFAGAFFRRTWFDCCPFRCLEVEWHLKMWSFREFNRRTSSWTFLLYFLGGKTIYFPVPLCLHWKGDQAWLTKEKEKNEGQSLLLQKISLKAPSLTHISSGFLHDLFLFMAGYSPLLHEKIKRANLTFGSSHLLGHAYLVCHNIMKK